MHAKLVYGIGGLLDPLCADESMSLHRGVALLRMPVNPDGIVYCAWYWLLGQFVPDRLSLYVVNDALLIGLPAYLLYLLLRRIGHAPSLAWAAAALLLVSRGNAVAWPFITHFVVVIGLGTALISTWLNDRRHVLSAALLGAFLLSYTRPEYLSLLACVVGLSLVHTFAELRRCARGFGAWLLPSLLGVLGCVGASIGQPYSAQRASLAFGQHFALSYSLGHHASSFDWTRWRDAVNAVFGGPVSLLQASWRNPHAVLQHVARNVEWTCHHYSDTFVPRFAANAPVPPAVSASASIAFVMLCARIVRACTGSVRARRWPNPVWLFTGAMAALGMTSALVLFPRAHYLVVPSAMAWLAGAHLWDQLPWPRRLRAAASHWSFLLILAAAALWITPFQLSGNDGLRPHDLVHMDAPHLASTQNRVRVLRALHARHPLVLLSSFLELPVFSPKTVRLPGTPYFDKSLPFMRLLRREHIEAVWLDAKLRSHPRFASDPELSRFVADPTRFGFRALDTGIAGETLLVRAGAVYE